MSSNPTGWTPIHSYDGALVYWHKPIDLLTRLSVKGREWKVHRRRDETDGWYRDQIGEAKTSASAKRAAEEAVR